MVKDKDLEELLEENTLLRQIIDDISDGIYAVDNNGTIIVYNKAMEKIEGTNRQFVLGYNEKEIYNTFSSDQYLRNEVIAKGASIKDCRVTYTMATGHKVEMVANTYLHKNSDNTSTFYCIIQDISGVNRLQERIVMLNNLLTNARKDSRAYSNGTVYTFPDILGESPVMQETIAKACHIAPSPSNVLIYGATGTGKELFAQSIHNYSNYKTGPFIAVNCASIPNTLLESQLFGTVKGAYSDAKDMPGLFEQATNGTLFLDEINSMDISLQAKMLRVLQDKIICRLGGQKPKKINCRIISATNKDPLDPDFKNYFREDLLYRLMPIMLYIPPLRERKEDIIPLCFHFIKELNKIYHTHVTEIDSDFTNILVNFNWPGNVRQLANLMESCICYLDQRITTLRVSHIPAYLASQFSLKKHQYHINGDENLNSQLDRYEKYILEESLDKSGGNMAKAARHLGISRQNINYRIKRLNIQPKVSPDKS